jgi:hypothetical protein
MPLTIFAMTHGLPSAVAIGTDLALHFGVTTHGLVLAQQVQNVDLMANLQNGWTDFLQTGKAGALAVGLVMGYTIRGVTR